jgi:uncharacterized protein (TIGR00251 family)
LEVRPSRDRSDGRVVLAVYVQPGAARGEVVGYHGDALKVRVAAPAQGGRANAALVRLLADALGVGPRAVEVTGGLTSRAKRVTLTGVDVDHVRRWLAQAVPDGG